MKTETTKKALFYLIVCLFSLSFQGKAQNGYLKGYIYEDINSNCTRDAGEPIASSANTSYGWYNDKNVFSNYGWFSITNGIFQISLPTGDYNIYPSIDSLFCGICSDSIGFSHTSITSNDTTYLSIGVRSICPKIEGTVYVDDNKDCIFDASEIGYTDSYVQAKKSTGEIFYGYTDSQGKYSIIVPEGTYDVEFLNYNYWWSYVTSTCNPYNVTLVNPSDISQNNDFGVTYNDTCSFLSGYFSEVGTIRPCSTSHIYFYTFNYIGVAKDVTIDITIDPNVTVISSTPMFNSQVGNVYSFNVGDLLGYNYIYFDVDIPCSLNIGDTICHSMNVNTTSTLCTIDSSYYYANNFPYTRCFAVGNSYDPNEKLIISPKPDLTGYNYIDSTDIITYQINFQNTGTDVAYNIAIVDSISPYLDPASIKTIGASHNYDFEMYGNGVGKWIFKNIMLPDSNTNEPQSHGMVSYSIKLKDNLPAGTQIKNTAGIYFDFNSPVITNTTVNTIVDPLSIKENKNSSKFNLFPNPANEQIYIGMKEITGEKEITVVDAIGKVVFKKKSASETEIINTKAFSNGIYYMILKSDNTIQNQKFVVNH